MDAWEKFKKNVEVNGLVSDGDRVLIAVSGGPDSVCLLHLFWRLRKTRPLTLFVAHFDHGLRTRSKREAVMVQRLGEKLSIPVQVRKLPVKKHASEKKISLETAGRELRYAALEELARELRCARIATGHTANDNAETVLMWLVRGTGPGGLSGIPIERRGNGKTTVIRPLLPVTRQEVMEYAETQKLPFCIDSSNFSPDYTRNRIRHKAVPLLEQFNPRLVEHLFTLSRIFAEENEFLDAAAAAAARRSVRVDKNRILLDLKVLFRYNKVIQSRVIKEMLPEKRSWSQIERLREWIRTGKDGERAFSRAWSVSRRNNRLQFFTARKRHHGS